MDDKLNFGEDGYQGISRVAPRNGDKDGPSIRDDSERNSMQGHNPVKIQLGIPSS